MVDSVTIRINVYNDSASGHVSISLPSGTYETTWSPTSIANTANDFTNIPLGGDPFTDAADAGAQLFIHATGLFSSSSMAQDGRIQSSDPERLIAASVTVQVSPTQAARMDEFAKDSLGIVNYGLLTGNCVNYVDRVLSAGGVQDSWRQKLKDSGTLPPNNPINYLLDPALDPKRSQGEPSTGTATRPSDSSIQQARDLTQKKGFYADAIIRKVAAAQTEREAQIAAAHADRDRQGGDGPSTPTPPSAPPNTTNTPNTGNSTAQPGDGGAGNSFNYQTSTYGTGNASYTPTSTVSQASRNGHPIVIDLDGDGVEISPLGGSAARFDYDGDGFEELSAWVGKDDGLLIAA